MKALATILLAATLIGNAHAEFELEKNPLYGQDDVCAFMDGFFAAQKISSSRQRAFLLAFPKKCNGITVLPILIKENANDIEEGLLEIISQPLGHESLCNMYLESIKPRSGPNRIEDECIRLGYRGSMYARQEAR